MVLCFSGNSASASWSFSSSSDRSIASLRRGMMGQFCWEGQLPLIPVVVVRPMTRHVAEHLRGQLRKLSYRKQGLAWPIGLRGLAGRAAFEQPGQMCPAAHAQALGHPRHRKGRFSTKLMGQLQLGRMNLWAGSLNPARSRLDASPSVPKKRCRSWSSSKIRSRRSPRFMT